MNTTATETAIYWGAFNPPTLAHIQVVQEVLKTTDITHVIISPSGEREDKDFWIEHADRRKLIEKYVEILKKLWLSVSLDTYFFDTNDSWVTTTKAEQEYFEDRLWMSPYFVFGSDTAENMSWWSNNENRFIEEKLKKIFIQRPWYSFDFEANGFREYILLDIPEMLDVSSSLAREMIHNTTHVRLDQYYLSYKSRNLKNLGMSRKKMNRASSLSPRRKHISKYICTYRAISTTYERSGYWMCCMTYWSRIHSWRRYNKRNLRRNLIHSSASRIPLSMTKICMNHNWANTRLLCSSHLRTVRTTTRRIWSLTYSTWNEK